MKLLIPVETLQIYKSRDLLPLKCGYCNEEFLRSKNDIQKVIKGSVNLTLAFCSLTCSSNAKKKTITTNCSQCCKPLKTLPCRIRKTKSGLSFCNKTCSAIYNNSHRILSKPNRTSYRDFALKRLPNQCNDCGYKKYLPVLEVHHKDRNRKNNRIENLIILCPTCHEEKHFLQKSGKYNKMVVQVAWESTTSL